MKKLSFLVVCVILIGFSSCQKDVFAPNSGSSLDGVQTKGDTTISVNGHDYVFDKDYLRDLFNNCQITDPNRDSDFIRKKGRK